MKREQQIIKRKHTSALLEANRASRKFEDVKKRRVDAFILFSEQVSDVLDDTHKVLCIITCIIANLNISAN